MVIGPPHFIGDDHRVEAKRLIAGVSVRQLFQPPQSSYPFGWPRCHFHAVSTTERKSRYFGRHPSSRCTLADAATNSGGSPGRRGPSFTGTFLPVTSSTAAMTSRTL